METVETSNMIYFKKDNVIFMNPIIRFLSKIFGKENFVIRCEVCNKIPCDIYGNRCEKHINTE
jgi:hypothetical protein